jgi:hypothetical protein
MITGGCAPPECNGLRLYGENAVPMAAGDTLAALSIHDLNELFAQPCNPVMHQDHPLQPYAAFLRRRLRPANFIELCLDVGNGLAGAEFEAIMATSCACGASGSVRPRRSRRAARIRSARRHTPISPTASWPTAAT